MISLPTDSSILYPKASAASTRRQFLTPIPSLPGEFLLVLDNTGIEKVKRCHVAGKNYLISGREPHAKNSALVFGGAIHEALELFHRGEWQKANGQLAPDPGVDIAAQTSIIHSFFASNPAPPDEYRTASSACEVMKFYRQRCNTGLYPDYEWEILSDERGPIIERAFELPLGVIEVNADIQLPYSRELVTVCKSWTTTKPIYDEAIEHADFLTVFVSRIHIAWSGRIDVIARVGGRARITDHKTSSIDRDDFMQSFVLSSQTIGYTWAAQQLWPNLDISGFCLNCLNFRKPAKSHTGELTSRGPKGGEPPLNFFRAYFDYTPLRIAEWYSRTMTTIEDFIHSAVRDNFPVNDHSCFDKFGRCPYHDICIEDNPEVAAALLQTDAFKSVTWNPTSGR